jgi:hypothetical protein
MAAAAALFVTPPIQASAQPTAPHVHQVSSAVLAPFNLAVSSHSLYVADGFTSLVSKVRKDGSLRTVATGPQPGEVAGVAVSRGGRQLAYTSGKAAGEMALVDTALTILGPGSKKKVADLYGYEHTANPDHVNAYGIANPTACQTKALGDQASYAGIKESHAYSVAALGHGAWAVADAAGNDIVGVDRHGKVSTIAVLPPQPLLITTAIAEALGVPADCFVGATYNFEPVPTDVEVGRDGWLYVTTLAGGPEDPRAGARSKVYRVNPRNGHVHEIASGLAGATNLALGDHGKIYVSELFGGRISVIKHGAPQTYVGLANAVSVEAGRRGTLYAGTIAPTDDQGKPTGPGTIVKITRGRVVPTT